MQSVAEALRESRVQTPAWLADYQAGAPFDRETFFRSRVVFYPGSGTDGHPIKVFGGAHAAHCFVYADYGVPQEQVKRQLENPAHVAHPHGYRPIHVESLTERELRPGGWLQHLDLRGTDQSRAMHELARRGLNAEPYALWSVLERRSELDDDHGASRLAILFVGGDGFATFDALFCQGDAAPPFAVLLQDHGFGGNWASFGGENSLMWRLAGNYARPEWLLCAENTETWPGYELVSDGDSGGMHNTLRSLYRQLP